MLGTAGTRNHGTTREQPLARFATERGLLASLPDHPPEIATWAKVTVHRDAHVQFELTRLTGPALATTVAEVVDDVLDALAEHQLDDPRHDDHGVLGWQGRGTPHARLKDRPHYTVYPAMCTPSMGRNRRRTPVATARTKVSMVALTPALPASSGGR